MEKIQVQGVHHITLVGATRQASIDFWEGVLGMPFVFEQPNHAIPTSRISISIPATAAHHGLYQRVARRRSSIQ